MDLQKLPKCPLRARSELITEYSHLLSTRTVDYVHGKYENADVLFDCLTFMDLDLLDCMRSDYDSLGRVWLFPATEAADELGESINRIIQCSYKAVRDNLRRAIELVLVGAYFSLSNISADNAKKWLNSERQTPFISRLLKPLCETVNFKILADEHKWNKTIQSFYWNLCDTIHTRGRAHSLRELQPAHGRINGVALPEFNEDSLDSCLDLFILTVRNISTILAAYNPVLLVGLPMVQKFGADGPFSGFFEYDQSDRLWRVIPKEFHQAFKTIEKQDMDVKSARDWVENLPDWNGIA